MLKGYKNIFDFTAAEYNIMVEMLRDNIEKEYDTAWALLYSIQEKSFGKMTLYHVITKNSDEDINILDIYAISVFDAAKQATTKGYNVIDVHI